METETLKQRIQREKIETLKSRKDSLVLPETKIRNIADSLFKGDSITRKKKLNDQIMDFIGLLPGYPEKVGTDEEYSKNAALFRASIREKHKTYLDSHPKRKEGEEMLQYTQRLEEFKLDSSKNFQKTENAIFALYEERKGLNIGGTRIGKYAFVPLSSFTICVINSILRDCVTALDSMKPVTLDNKILYDSLRRNEYYSYFSHLDAVNRLELHERRTAENERSSAKYKRELSAFKSKVKSNDATKYVKPVKPSLYEVEPNVFKDITLVCYVNKVWAPIKKDNNFRKEAKEFLADMMYEFLTKAVTMTKLCADSCNRVTIQHNDSDLVINMIKTYFN
jgi:hypothetical protein